MPALDELEHATATLLANGKVLITGGTGTVNNRTVAIATAGIYDPTGSGRFTAIRNMEHARYHHEAVMLENGTVLISGGVSDSDLFVKSVELYDPRNPNDNSDDSFTSLTDMNQVRVQHTMTLLDNDKVLITGGFKRNAISDTFMKSTELYELSPSHPTGKTTAGPEMTMIRAEHTANKLNDGKVVLIGGYTGSDYTNKAELYDPDTGDFSLVPDTEMSVGLGLHSATVLDNHSILIIGGRSVDTDTNGLDYHSLFLLVPNTARWL